MEREFDIIVWGATGYTGRLVAEYLCTNYGVNQSFCWALAGRSVSKLQRLQLDLCKIDKDAKDLKMIIADSFSPELLQKMTTRSKVVCSTVGPYSLYGADLVAACVETGTDYCDLTGETPFIRKMIDLHHPIAKQKKVKIVHACGYDSIPSDIGVLYLQQEMLRRYGGYAEQIKFYTGATKGGVSGGTIASMINLFDTATTDRFVRRNIGNPYALNPNDGYKGLDKGDQRKVLFDSDAGKWTAPFLMAGINTRIVRRSHALQAYEYGECFRYSEVMGFPSGVKGWTQAAYFSILMGIFVALSLHPLSRKFVRLVVPKPGQGPTKKQRESGYFSVHLRAKKDENVMWAKVQDNLDPGYGSTAKMLSESALALALKRADLPNQYGVLTPAVAIGGALITRLCDAGMRFTVVEK